MPAYAARPSCGSPFWLEPYRLAVGVGSSDDEDALAKMRSPDVGGSNLDGARSVSELAQVPPHHGQPRGSTVSDVLDDDGEGLALVDDAGELEPQAGSGPVEPGLSPGDADVLAWEPAADEVDGLKAISANCCDIIEPLRFRPVLREHATTPLILFDLPHDVANAGPLEAKLQAADSAEQ